MSSFTRDARVDDLPAIDRLFRASFGATFGHLYSAKNLATFLADFTPANWRREFEEPRFAFRIAELDRQPVGYAKIGPMALPTSHGPNAVELYQLYLLDEAKGKGISGELMDWVFARARSLGGDELFLSVFIANPRARRFYRRHGFAEIGPYHFMVGDHADEDIIMRRPL